MNQINLNRSSKHLLSDDHGLKYVSYACYYNFRESFVLKQQSYHVNLNSRSIACNEGVRQQKKMTYLLHLWNTNHFETQALKKYIAPKFIKIAEQYIAENIRQSPLKIEEIAAYANVSIRTLSNGFRKYRNISPSLFIRDLRLQIVRKDLMNAPIGASIAEIAYASGYLNLGTFIRLYKQKFGELPSTTLRYDPENIDQSISEL
ncbi:helix-turn-helix domain-containing protein [Acinetobacter qingfengensis]|uniref:helix-turn-helix domain-containing protein n=1 Tax=Acinetobacter qingfengensis TaxID=1262585 RepID=UPI000AB99A43|nr:helix-turn-helix domain-containing protein [Acinetobacter qingfengensis]